MQTGETTMLTTTAMAPASAKNEKRVTNVFLAAVALIIGAASVSIYSQMGGTNLAPTLAKDLTHQSELRSEINRLRIRVATVHFPPYLAANLHELSVRLAEAGDNVGALKAVDNAASIRRHLAQANPARYTASLELSLQLRSQMETTREASGMKTEETVVR
jgi:hypothetical protein